MDVLPWPRGGTRLTAAVVWDGQLREQFGAAVGTLNSLLQDIQNILGFGEKHLSLLGRLNSVAPPVKQRDAKLQFECVDHFSQ
jgi:hypothetical protein